ncbi:hypothetical protein F442_13010 [Phytophthora nicotianae P10297]|uniref:Uncharacterized protein n=3 Tax=Phytophthora nicotianae TaxID=4792 RepID=V9EU94_PHYNI|nr:hypothetical protein F443_13137 [Phytophthora nicotianae P1569]ETP39529.1 hypothetical protein F442_13010 [Phytophthora nicotianae P10297]
MAVAPPILTEQVSKWLSSRYQTAQSGQHHEADEVVKDRVTPTPATKLIAMHLRPDFTPSVFLVVELDV